MSWWSCDGHGDPPGHGAGPVSFLVTREVLVDGVLADSVTSVAALVSLDLCETEFRVLGRKVVVRFTFDPPLRQAPVEVGERS